MTIEKEELIAYLGMIQGVITRMANNAFLIKGWSIGLTTAMLALAGGTKNEIFCLISALPVLLFWWLDAFFFYQEKKYRDIYDYAKSKDLTEENLFSLDPNMLIDRKKEKDNKLSVRWQIMKENAVYPIYAIQLMILIVAYPIVSSLT
ncbi:hypothetical protein AB4077_19220 [Vibrio cyclitrophicus]|uniref:hypothetical protein n=1 Tax=Vibrio cyclitrophicus TaxID=47951 RepID=UPI000C8314DB|nr:hypothetical protein [Vibrio cyclitrophicus]MCC4774974.1 hypothetical protein [Vibrio cyclitrophicus]MCC4844083.1 hypothetical protein [Vibrio cyclitrophicus]PME12663.1 hypothetical protein BCV42_18890 [Vibrio cyclitrophicus]PME36419.1 hypothetical protein BCV37_20830 [Vibrio cyclitrophicus]PME80349.1 hypothetical protein BCV28_19425 [Vibrio cyclitrophicus]